MLLVSACLAGRNCKYSGGNNLVPEIAELVLSDKALAICPEELGGLSTPRPACEIVGGNGEAVLKDYAKVVNYLGKDVTIFFVQGANEVLKIAKRNGINTAILKERSPSCGSDYIYDGSFSGRLQKAEGVTTALLRQNNIKVFSEESFNKIFSDQKKPLV